MTSPRRQYEIASWSFINQSSSLIGPVQRQNLTNKVCIINLSKTQVLEQYIGDIYRRKLGDAPRVAAGV